jgi:hypothetical protein
MLGAAGTEEVQLPKIISKPPAEGKWQQKRAETLSTSKSDAAVGSAGQISPPPAPIVPAAPASDAVVLPAPPPPPPVVSSSRSAVQKPVEHFADVDLAQDLLRRR